MLSPPSAARHWLGSCKAHDRLSSGRVIECPTLGHERQLAALVERVSAAIDRYRDGELDAFGVDEVSDVGQAPQ